MRRVSVATAVILCAPGLGGVNLGASEARGAMISSGLWSVVGFGASARAWAPRLAPSIDRGARITLSLAETRAGSVFGPVWKDEVGVPGEPIVGWSEFASHGAPGFGGDGLGRTWLEDLGLSDDPLVGVRMTTGEVVAPRLVGPSWSADALLAGGDVAPPRGRR